MENIIYTFAELQMPPFVMIIHEKSHSIFESRFLSTKRIPKSQFTVHTCVKLSPEWTEKLKLYDYNSKGYPVILEQICQSIST